jgi:hypothetical protein
MVYKNAKEGTGVRARGDLTANQLPQKAERPRTAEDLRNGAQFLNGMLKGAKEHKLDSVELVPRVVERVIDYLLVGADALEKLEVKR